MKENSIACREFMQRQKEETERRQLAVTEGRARSSGQWKAIRAF